MRSALLVGATGLVGSELLELLRGSAEYGTVHLLTRRPLDRGLPRVIQHLIDFENLPQVEIEAMVEDVFCTLGTTIGKAGSVDRFQRVDRDYVCAVGELARRLGAQRFSVVSAVGANPASLSFYNRTKGEMEERLAALGLASVRIFRPSLLLGERRESRPKEAVARGLLTAVRPLLVGRLEKYRPVAAAQVARAMYLSSLRDYPGVRIFESDEIQAIAEEPERAA